MMIQDFIKPSERPTAYSDLSLMAELYLRGYKIEDIFARFFEFDVHAIQAEEEARLTPDDVLKYARKVNPKLEEKKGKVF